MAKYHGRRGWLYMAPDGTGQAVKVAALSEWTLNQTREKVDTTSFDDDNKTNVQGLADTTGSFSGFWDNTDDTIFDASESTSAVRMYLYPSRDVSGRYWYGTAWVDYSISVSVNDAVKVTGNFSAAGSWGRQ